MKRRHQGRICGGPYSVAKRNRTSSCVIHLCQSHCLAAGPSLSLSYAHLHSCSSRASFTTHSKLVRALVLTSFRSCLLPRRVPHTTGSSPPQRQSSDNLCNRYSMNCVPGLSTSYTCMASSTLLSLHGECEQRNQSRCSRR